MFEFLSVIFRNALHRPATREYPKTVREPFEKQKGHVTIDIPGCIFCGMCSRKCPAGSIEVKRAEKSWSIDRYRCILCNACVESCPKKCLSMDPHYTPPAYKKSVDVYRAADESAGPAGHGENRGA